jgi:hypothetical protein
MTQPVTSTQPSSPPAPVCTRCGLSSADVLDVAHRWHENPPLSNAWRRACRDGGWCDFDRPVGDLPCYSPMLPDGQMDVLRITQGDADVERPVGAVFLLRSLFEGQRMTVGEGLLRVAEGLRDTGRLFPASQVSADGAHGEGWGITLRLGMPRAALEQAAKAILRAGLHLLEHGRLVAQPKAEPAPQGEKTGATMGLWRKAMAGCKYLVLRRDNTVPSWPYFVLGARDPYAPAALRAYAIAAERGGANAQFVTDIMGLADEFDAYRKTHGDGDPDAVPHRTDDPVVVARMVAEPASPAGEGGG